MYANTETKELERIADSLESIAVDMERITSKLDQLTEALQRKEGSCTHE
jgi:division protein CdvB (Snf7/Vps24/ESCRT-III family)